MCIYTHYQSDEELKKHNVEPFCLFIYSFLLLLLLMILLKSWNLDYHPFHYRVLFLFISKCDEQQIIKVKVKTDLQAWQIHTDGEFWNSGVCV